MRTLLTSTSATRKYELTRALSEDGSESWNVWERDFQILGELRETKLVTELKFQQSSSMDAHEQIIRSQHAEFSICDPSEWVYPALYVGLFAYSIFCILSARDSMKNKGPEPISQEEFAKRFTKALEDHASRCELYLQLLDLLVVADPSGAGERHRIKQNFRTAIKKLPKELISDALDKHPDTAAEETVASWADACWNKCVVDASQPVPRARQNRRRSIRGQPVQRRSRKEENDDASSDDESKTNERESIRTTTMVLDWRSDLHDEWTEYRDLIRACGVDFTSDEINALDEEGSIFETFVPEFIRRLHAVGYTLLSMAPGDGDTFAFLQIKDIEAVRELLSALHPTGTDANRLYGDIRLLEAGESYEEPVETNKTEEKSKSNKTQEKSKSGFPFPLIFFGVLIAFLVVGYAVISAFRWACLESKTVVWLSAVFIDCLGPSLLCAALGLSVVFLFHVIVVNPTLYWMFVTPSTAEMERRRSTRGNPESVPLPKELLQL